MNQTMTNPLKNRKKQDFYDEYADGEINMSEFLAKLDEK